MSAEFQVGEEVRIIAKPPDNERLGGPGWIPEMTKFCGEIHKIVSVASRGWIKLENVRHEGLAFSWLPEWLELVEPEPVDTWLDELEVCFADEANGVLP